MKIKINKIGNNDCIVPIRRITNHDRTENVFRRIRKRVIKNLIEV
jgi:hypothetical protein